MSKDLSKLLADWPHGDGPTVRRIVGEDGREKIQIRVCIDTFHGILQFDCDGRPDGQRPHGKEFYFDHLEERKRRYADAGGKPAEFRLTRSQCRRLFEESGMVYQRYVVMLQIGDYERVIRDTSRNMRLFKFVHDHASREEDRGHLECWWPYVLRIHHTAIVMDHLGTGRLNEALESIASCRKRIEGLASQENEVFQNERTRSLEALEQMEKQIRERRPLTEIEKLERAQRQAIEQERFEEAARLRDKIKAIRSREEKPPSSKREGD